MFAAVYLAIGALVGVLVRSPVNGTVVILFIWIMDVFFGPALSSADQRLTLAGFRTGALLWERLGVVGLAVLLVTVASLAVTATVFDARQWGVYAGGNLLLAATYSLLGGCLGPIFGRVSGVFLAFLLPFLDVGIGQSPMLRARPPAWAQILPGYGADRVLLDGGLTAHFDETGALLLGLGWLLALGVLAALLFRRARTGHARTR